MKNIIFLSFFLCLIMACVKEGPPGPKGPDGPPYTWPPGNITGYIEFRDQFGALLFTVEKDSVLVQTYNADSVFRAYTDSTGYFILSDVPPGNYDISISKAGYDSLHMYVKHAGGEIDKFTGTTSMSQPITTRFVSITAQALIDISSNVIRVNAQAVFEWPKPPGKLVSGFRFFLDRSAVPGDGRLAFDVPAQWISDIDGVTGRAIATFQLPITTVPSGTQLYVTAAAAPPATAYKPWLDYTSGAQIPYPYLGDSIKTIITYIEE
ncbi:carboxypeptidase-like regulatory domain-containing protein [Chitinophaga filiformis]|uniref:carboxypeptidase-like regulatory domain-containing protein n=1 Tax=Chitinophaga filiformis TaxID=104663 RepID=UPI001F39DD9D|nr:carboxypeptidase-like regulatory domain-containing protein [Chitinophaga filiformis]MCF6406576.1 carboxypeptidase-like regulatory domain-containing protein [Chitinophaga filiformis]